MKSSKRIILIALMLGMIVTTALAEEKGSFSKINQESIIIVPYYTYTYSITASLSFEGNKAKCGGSLSPIGKDSVSLTITLYKQNGTQWDYISSWNGEATGGRTATASGSANVSSGTYKVVANGNVGNKEYPSASDTKTKP